MARATGLRRVVRSTIAAAQKRKAQWVPLFPGEMSTNTGGEPVICMSTALFPPNALECPNLAVTHLIPGFMGPETNPLRVQQLDQLEEGFYVHRLELNLYVQTSFDTPAGDCRATSLFLQKFNERTIVRAGLVKQRWEADGTAGPTPSFLSFNPVESLPFETFDNSGDYCDAKWMWMREHQFVHRRVRTAKFVPRLEPDLNPQDDCDECVDCDPEQGFGPYFNLSVEEALPWKLRIRLKRKVPLHFKSGDGLTLFLGWENLRGTGPDRAVQPNLLLESAGGRAYISR